MLTEKYYNQLKDERLRADGYTYGALVQSCARAKRPDLAEMYFEELLQVWIPPGPTPIPTLTFTLNLGWYPTRRMWERFSFSAYGTG